MSVAISFGALKGYKAGFVEKQAASAEILAGSGHIEIRGFRIDQVEMVVRSPVVVVPFPTDTKGPTGSAAQPLTYEAECLDLSQRSKLSFEVILDPRWRRPMANNVTGQSQRDTRGCTPSNTCTPPHHSASTWD